MTITKERFLLVRCTPLGEQKLPAAAQVVQASIRDSVQENFGDFGVGCVLTLLQVRHYSSDTGLLLVRVAREHATMLRAALTLVCFVSNQPVRLTAISAAGVCLHPPLASAARAHAHALAHLRRSACVATHRQRALRPTSLDAAAAGARGGGPGGRRLEDRSAAPLESHQVTYGVTVVLLCYNRAFT